MTNLGQGQCINILEAKSIHTTFVYDQFSFYYKVTQSRNSIDDIRGLIENQLTLYRLFNRSMLEAINFRVLSDKNFPTRIHRQRT